MPGGDGTGPWGRGAGTGWGRGGCVPIANRARGFRNRGFGRFFGAGRNSFVSLDEVSDLKAERDLINARLAEIEKEKK